MAEEPQCKECGGPVPQLGRGRPRQFCSEKCKARFFNRRSRRSRLPLVQARRATCARCGGEFTARSRDRIYCGDTCKVAAYRERRAQGVRRVGSHEVVCDECGTPFTSVRPEARWCSKECANRHWGRMRSRQRRLPTTAAYSDREIFERDGWRCHLCGKRIFKSKRWPDQACGTIDHIVPLSEGGRDEPSNVAAAHWRCNREKRAQALGEQLRLN